MYFSANAFLPDYLHHIGRADLVSAALTALNVGQIPASLLLLAVAGRLERAIWPHIVCGAGSLAAIIGIAVLPGPGIVVCAAVLGFFAAAILILMLALPPLLAPPDDVHRVSAAMFTISYSCAVITPVFSGLAWDLTGIAQSAFVPLGALRGPADGARADHPIAARGSTDASSSLSSCAARGGCSSVPSVASACRRSSSCSCSSSSSDMSSAVAKRFSASLDREDEFGQLELQRHGVAVLRVLNQEHHQERHDRGRGVDDELPGVAVAEQRPGRAHTITSQSRSGMPSACRSSARWRRPWAKHLRPGAFLRLARTRRLVARGCSCANCCGLSARVVVRAEACVIHVVRAGRTRFNAVIRARVPRGERAELFPRQPFPLRSGAPHSNEGEYPCSVGP